MVSTLPTSRKVLLQLEYNHARDEIISGGSDGCFVWRLEAIPCELYALGEVVWYVQTDRLPKNINRIVLPRKLDEGEKMWLLR